MSKEAETNSNTLYPLLKQRWSPRAFDDRPVEAQKIRNIFEAARWAPSASNLQPWIFFVGIKGDKTYDMIYNTLVEFNQMWASFAPVLILNCGITASDEGKPFSSWRYDTGQAVALLSIQAMAEGLHVHQMAGFDALKAAELFSLPENTRAVTVTALGYIGDPAMLHPRMQKSELAPRERKEIGTFVFSEEFGSTSEIVK